MPARTGQQYLDGLREQDREVWLGGERVKDVTTHPGLRGARAIAALYDMQCDPKLRDEMTFISPKTGDRVGLSFIIPRTREDLERRRVMMLNWARATCGMMGRSPDFMNVTFAAWAGAADYFAQGPAGVRREHAALLRLHPRERPGADPLADQPAAQPHRLRHVQPAGGHRAAGGKETDAGIVVRGARVLATLGPFADEIAVYSPRLGAAHRDATARSR